MIDLSAPKGKDDIGVQNDDEKLVVVEEEQGKDDKKIMQSQVKKQSVLTTGL